MVEINIPADGTNRRLAGVYLEDPATGNLFLGHRGKIGGGAEGVGKKTFREWSKGDWRIVEDAGTESEILAIAELDDSQRLLAHLTAFALDVNAFKIATKSGGKSATPRLQDNAFHVKDDYSPEFYGTREVPTKNGYVASCDHGLIVEALREWIQASDPKARTMNRGHRFDLIAESKRQRILFEVKTSADTQSVYTGIGQLMFYNMKVQAAKIVLVLPKNKLCWKERLQPLGVEVLVYTIERDGCYRFGT